MGTVSKGRIVRSYKNLTLLLIGVFALAAIVVFPQLAGAHPLGNFTVNQYSRIEIAESGLRVVYVLDMAEIPAFQERQKIDTNGDRAVDETESTAYLSKTVPEIIAAMSLLVDGNDVALNSAMTELTFPEGQGGLSILRLRLILEPVAPDLLSTDVRSIRFKNDYANDRIGWREIVVTHGRGVSLSGIEAAATDTTDELRRYPEDLLTNPLDQREVEFDAALAPGPEAPGYAAFVANTGATDHVANRPNGGESGTRFAALLDRESTTMGFVVAMLAAMLWGAAHALSPGHGKTIVGAYLVGSKGTPRHAAFLGLIVTITHTAGVISLGLVTLLASNYILPEQLFPWISVSSGLAIVGLGLWTLNARLRGESGPSHHHHHGHDHGHDYDHEHDGYTHSHLPPEGQRLSLRSLVALGISGGLLPCPSALVVLLGSIALGRVSYGLALVVAFSFGLALTLTGVGLAFLYAGRLLDTRINGQGRSQTIFRYGPAIGSFALIVAGTVIILRALGQTGFS